MTEEEQIKRRIKKKLEEIPKFKIYCLLCGKLCCTTSEQREIIHYDCWVEWKKSRQKPTENR